MTKSNPKLKPRLAASSRLRAALASPVPLVAKPPSMMLRPPGQERHFPELTEEEVRKLWPFKTAVQSKQKLDLQVAQREHYLKAIEQKHGRINGDLARRMIHNKAYLNVRASSRVLEAAPEQMLFSTQIMSLSDFKAAARADTVITSLVKDIESQMRILDHKYGSQAASLGRELLGPFAPSEPSPHLH